MSLKKYVKKNIYGMPSYLIWGDVIVKYQLFMGQENPAYYNELLEELTSFTLMLEVVNGNEDRIIKKADEIKVLFQRKLKENIMMFIKEISLEEQEKEELMPGAII